VTLASTRPRPVAPDDNRLAFNRMQTARRVDASVTRILERRSGGARAATSSSQLYARRDAEDEPQSVCARREGRVERHARRMKDPR